eukprot:jgi/Mesvir1/21623/Mv04046-RA.1
MGSGASSPAKQGAEEEAYPEPFQRGDATLALCIPRNENISARFPKVLLQIDSNGFTLLRPIQETVILHFPFPQVHSWTYTNTCFCFNHYEERTKCLREYALDCSHVRAMMKALDDVIKSIIGLRQQQCLSEAGFMDVVRQMAAMEGSQRSAFLHNNVLPAHYFMSLQARELLSLLPCAFEQVEAACSLHERIVDQNKFSTVVLGVLQDPADRENVWHRLGQKSKDIGSKSLVRSMSWDLVNSGASSPTKACMDNTPMTP